MTLEDTIRQSVREEVRTVVREELRAVLAELKPAAPAPEALLTVDQVAARVGGVSRDTVRAWIKSGKLEAKRGGHRLLVDPQALAAFLAAAGSSEKLEELGSDEHLNLLVDRIDSKRSKKR